MFYFAHWFGYKYRYVCVILQGVCTEAGMYALRERRVHVTQEDFELSVAKVNFDGYPQSNCLMFNEFVPSYLCFLATPPARTWYLLFILGHAKGF